jgi:hypothetical protein
MVRDQIEAIEQRDQGLQKLSDLTKNIFYWALGLLAVFSVTAAVTNPGQSPGSSSSSTSQAGFDDSTTQTQFTDDGQQQQQLQAPTQGSYQPSYSRPVAVSGGSHAH